MSPTEPCIFCRIAKKEVRADIIYEDGDTLAFLDIRPRSPGHTMVIPKDHIQTLFDISPEALGPLFLAVKKVAELLEQSLHPDGFTYGINQGRASGQEVGHLHVHIMPRWVDDGGSSIQSAVNNPPEEDLKEIAERIKSLAQER